MNELTTNEQIKERSKMMDYYIAKRLECHKKEMESIDKTDNALNVTKEMNDIFLYAIETKEKDLIDLIARTSFNPKLILGFNITMHEIYYMHGWKDIEYLRLLLMNIYNIVKFTDKNTLQPFVNIDSNVDKMREILTNTYDTQEEIVEVVNKLAGHEYVFTCCYCDEDFDDLEIKLEKLGKLGATDFIIGDEDKKTIGDYSDDNFINKWRRKWNEKQIKSAKHR